MIDLLNNLQSPWIETLGWCLLHSIWQITLPRYCETLRRPLDTGQVAFR